MIKRSPPVPFELQPARVAYTHYISSENLVVPGFSMNEVYANTHQLGMHFDYCQHDYCDGDYKLVLPWDMFRTSITPEQARMYAHGDYPESMTDLEVDKRNVKFEKTVSEIDDRIDPNLFAFAVCLIAAMDASNGVVRELIRSNKLAISITQ